MDAAPAPRPTAVAVAGSWLERLLAWHRVVAVLALGTVSGISLRPGVAYDTWWHLATGRWMVEHGSVVRSDPFSFTRAGESWMDPAWLADLLLYSLYRAGGVPALRLLVAAVFVTVFALVWRRLAGPPWLRLAVLTLAALTAVHATVPRPLLFSVLLVATVDAVLAAGRGRPRVLWVLPALVALWANLHAAFVLGPALIGLHAVAETVSSRRRDRRTSPAARRLWLVALLSVGAVALNPYGPRLLVYPLETLRLGVLGLAVQEWQPPSLLSPSGMVLYLVLATTAAALLCSRRPVSAAELLVAATFGALSTTAIRHSFLVGILLAPIAARHLADVIGGTRSSATPAARPKLAIHAVLVVAIASTVGGLGLRALTSPPEDPGADAPAPVAAVDHLATLRPQGRIFNDYAWGGYVIWALYPAYPTFIDGRTDLFGDDHVRTYLDASLAAPGWRRTFADWDIRIALLRPGLPLVDALREAGWRTEFDDGMAVILVRPS